MEDKERAANLGYQLLQRLGSGAFGTVYKASKNGNVFALKIVSKKNDQDIINATRHELDYLRQLSAHGCNLYIVCYYGYQEDQQNFYVEMEFIDGLTMNEYVRSLRPSLSAGDLHLQILRLAKEVSLGLAYAHSQGIIHNDIKPENIMITRDGKVKIIDFGLSCKLSNGKCNTGSGTIMYSAPEFVLSWVQGMPVKDPATDMWALGVSLYYLVMRRYPFKGATDRDVLDNILSTPADTLPFDTSIPLLYRVVLGLLNDDGDKRLTAAQLSSQLTNVEAPIPISGGNVLTPQTNIPDRDYSPLEDRQRLYGGVRLNKQSLVNMLLF